MFWRHSILQKTSLTAQFLLSYFVKKKKLSIANIILLKQYAQNCTYFQFINIYIFLMSINLPQTQINIIIKNMDPQQQKKQKSIEDDLSLLMPRRANKKDSFKNTKTVSFYTNYYGIGIRERKTKIYQYSFSLPQVIPKDSGLYNLALNSIKQQLRKKIGLITYSGQILWGINPIKTAVTFACQFKVDQETYKHEAIVAPVKQFSLFQLDAYQTRQSYTHILNSYLKNTFKALKYTQLGRHGQYYINKQIQGLLKDKSQNKLSEDGLCVLQGFRANLTQLNSGLYLQLDVCSRVLQTQNLLKDFDNKGSEFIKQNFTGKIVITKYGTLRTYQILEIDYSKSPKSTFMRDKGDQITFQKYYKQVYGLSVINFKQPLLLVLKSTKKVLQKNKKQMKQVKQYAYLLPQFVSLAGLRDNQRQNKDIMGNLSKFTKLTPKTRVYQCQKIINDINKCQSIIEVGHQKTFEGYQLGLPFLTFSPKEKEIQPSWKGVWNERPLLKQPYYFDNWLVVFSIKKEAQAFCRMEANKTINLFKAASKAYGIKFNDPTFLQIKSSSVSIWQQKIQKELERNKDIKIVVVLFQDQEEKHYQHLKRLLTNGLKIPIPSQFLKFSSLKSKNAMSIASKIIIQMNTKVGASPWKVQKHHPYFKDKKLMYGSLSISKGEKGYTLAFVGTGKDDCTQVYSQCQTGLKTKQNIPVQKLSKIFSNWAKNYFLTNNRTNSDLIILYLEGLSIPQTQQQLKNLLIPALQLTKQKVSHNTNSKFDPQIMIITVNKKAKSRFYEKLQNGSMQNVEAGSVIIEPLSQEGSYDFHMAAQYVSQGTCNPTVFRVAYDKTKMPQQALINFTFEQCFNYYNWQGAVRVPACLQNANKLSKLVSMHIKENISISELCKKQFFL